MTDAPPDPIPYLRLFPWLRIFRCAGLACEPKALMIATIGLILTWLGASTLSRFQPTPSVSPTRPMFEPNATSSVYEPYSVVMAPLVRDIGTTMVFPSTPLGLLTSLWPVAVWAVIGGAIARMGVVRLATDERVGLVEAVRFSVKKWPSLIGSMLVPVLGVIVLAVPLALFGLLYRLGSSVGPTLAGILAILPLITGLTVAIVVLAPALGWPLMIASVAAEDEDAFDAVSRNYAYLHQRPWQYLAYVALAGLIGFIGLTFVEFFGRLVLGLTVWGLSLTGPEQDVHGFFSMVTPSGSTLSPTALTMHGFWLSLFALVVRSWVFSFFWTAFSAIYLLLRREIDGTPLSTVARKTLSVRVDPTAASATD